MVVVKYVLPAIRALIAKELVEKHGLKQVRAAERMGVTPAAVPNILKRSGVKEQSKWLKVRMKPLRSCLR